MQPYHCINTLPNTTCALSKLLLLHSATPSQGVLSFSNFEKNADALLGGFKPQDKIQTPCHLPPSHPTDAGNHRPLTHSQHQSWMFQESHLYPRALTNYSETCPMSKHIHTYGSATNIVPVKNKTKTLSRYAGKATYLL